MSSSPATFLTEIVPSSGTRLRLDDPALRDWIAERYAAPDTAFVRLNMVTTPTGSAIGSDGTSETITSRLDRLILGCIRAASDAVIVGAQTVRSEGYIVPTRTRLAVLTHTGNLDGNRFADDDRDRVLLVCPAEAESRVRATAPGFAVLSVEGAQRPMPQAIVSALHDVGLRRLVCEGGPSVATSFLDAGVIDEACLSIAPVIEPAGRPFADVARRPDSDVVGFLADDAGFSFLRLRLRR